MTLEMRIIKRLLRIVNYDFALNEGSIATIKFEWCKYCRSARWLLYTSRNMKYDFKRC